MDKRLFEELIESTTEAGEIARGERAPAREFHVNETDVRRIHLAPGLPQARFAKLIHVKLGTLRNWEQRRRTPTSPAQALLRAVENSPRGPSHHRLTLTRKTNQPKVSRNRSCPKRSPDPVPSFL